MTKMDMSLRIQSDAGITEYADLTTEAELVTQRLDSPAKFTFTCIQQGVCGIEAGNHVSFAVGVCLYLKVMFLLLSRIRMGKLPVTAYDQLRYLKANASYVFEAMTLGR